MRQERVELCTSLPKLENPQSYSCLCSLNLDRNAVSLNIVTLPACGLIVSADDAR